MRFHTLVITLIFAYSFPLTVSRVLVFVTSLCLGVSSACSIASILALLWHRSLSMSDLIRDTIAGHLIRLVTKGKYLKYQEEIDPSLVDRYVNNEKSGNFAQHGQAEAPKENDDEEKKEGEEGDKSDNDENTRQQSKRRSSASSNDTKVDKDAAVNHPSGKKIDSEKGKDVHVVDWWGPDDPEVSKSSLDIRHEQR